MEKDSISFDKTDALRYCNISFALLTKPDKKLSVQATPWYSCRDYINDSLIAQVNDRVFSMCAGPAYARAKYDFKRLRLLVCSGDNKDKILNSKKIINVYEKLAGFKNKTKIKYLSTEHGRQIYVVEGPGEWMKCSQLTSMITLILRCCQRSTVDNSDIKTIEDINDFWKKSIVKGQSCADYNTYLPLCYPRWEVLMKNFDLIFHGLDPEVLYPSAKVNSWHGPGGVYSLCCFRTGILKLDKRFLAIWEEQVNKSIVKKYNPL